MIAYKNQQYYLLFTQYETEVWKENLNYLFNEYIFIQDDSKRPLCLMTQTGLNDEYLVVSWFGGIFENLIIEGNFLFIEFR